MDTQIEPLPEPLVKMPLVEFSINDLFLLGLSIFLLIASALFAGAEVAFFSIGQSEKQLLKKSNSKSAVLADKLLQNPSDLLATILIAKNFLNVSFVVITEILIVKLMMYFQIHGLIVVFTNIVFITLFIIFVGESFPKLVAFKSRETYARIMAYPIFIFQKLPPFSWLKYPLSNSSAVLEKRAKKKGVKFSKEALNTVLTLSESATDIKDEYNMLQGVVRFGNTEVKQVMCPRIDIVGIEENSSLDEVVKTVLEAGYSRIPVYKETFKEITGLIVVKDLLPYLALKKDFDWRSLIREPFFVPENKKIDDLLKEFQTKKNHLAIVIDEYGGCSGLVTLEDILEEIVGDITDEYDDDKDSFTKINQNTYLFEGRTPLLDFYKILSIDGSEFEEIKQNAETLGGFIVQTQGRILKVGEKMKCGNVTLIVEASDKKKIKKIRVELEELT